MPTSRRMRQTGAAIALVALLAVALAAPVTALTITKDEGPRGNFTLVDTSDMPGARCGYSDPNAAGFARLRWIRVKAPQVFAADRDSGIRDSRVVGWSFKIQRLRPGGAWVNVASSTQQQARAYEDQAAALSAKKVYYKATNDGSLYRALATLKWFSPDGSVEAVVKFRLDYYGVKWSVGDASFVYAGACDAAAD